MTSGRPRAPRDEALVGYVEAIEAVLRTRRGRDHVLVAARLRSRPRVARRRACRSRPCWWRSTSRSTPTPGTVEPRRAAPTRRGAGGARPAAGGPGRRARPSGRACPRCRSGSQALRERLLELPGRVAARPLADVEEVADLVAVASRPNWDYLRDRLRRIDEIVAAAAVEALSPDEARAVRDEAERAGEPPPRTRRPTRRSRRRRAPRPPAGAREAASAARRPRVASCGRDAMQADPRATGRNGRGRRSRRA